MEKITKNPAATSLIGFIVGLVLGLFILGWGLWPVRWENAAFKDLRPIDKQQYIAHLADYFAVTNDVAGVQQRYEGLQAGRKTALDAAITAAPEGSAERQRLETLKNVLAQQGVYADGMDAGPAPGLFEMLLDPLLWLTLLLVIGGWGAYAYLVGMGISATPKVKTAAQQANAARQAAEADKTDYTSAEAMAATPTGKPPVSQFMTTYVLGDDLFDDSFSVDGPDGSFLGECGMGISETMGVGDPKKVIAFEAWIFDKNDIRTVTKVLMSEHAFRDEALKSRLSAKGEPVIAKPGEIAQLETNTLIVQVRVVDMAYGGGALPPNSFFERLTVELAVFQK